MKISPNFMRLRWLLLLVCLLAGCGGSSGADSADDAKKWQGTWKMVSCTYDGAPQSADMEWIVDGDHYTIRLDGSPIRTLTRLRSTRAGNRSTSFITIRRRGRMAAS